MNDFGRRARGEAHPPHRARLEREVVVLEDPVHLGEVREGGVAYHEVRVASAPVSSLLLPTSSL